MCLLCAVLYAQNKESDFETDGSGTITKYMGWDTAVVIPAAVGGKPVTAIGENVFARNDLTGVTLPGTVKTIGSGAFAGNGALQSVTIGNEVVFPATAFAGMSDSNAGENFYYDYVCNGRRAGTYALDAQRRPPKRDGDFEYIETKYGAFITGYYGSSGNRLVIPDRVKGLAVKAITGLESKEIGRAFIPNSVTYIANRAFYRNQLAEITIPASVTYIGDHAFASNQLTIAAIPGTVKTIGSEAFAYNKLNSVSIGRGVTAIGSSAFAGNPLTSVAIPGTVTFIDRKAFKYHINVSGKISVLTIDSGVESIGTEAFAGNQLTGIVIPDSVTVIGTAAFAKNHLTSITIPSSVTVIGDGAFYRNHLTSVTISEGPAVISDNAFAYNLLTCITIPDSVTVIGANAFAGNRLTSVTIGADVSLICNAYGYRAFPNSLVFLYENNGKKAGIYTRENASSDKWTFKARGSR
jgi:hypothetical protein